MEINAYLAVISFHSLEDRLVKNYFRDNKVKKNRIFQNNKSWGFEILTKKPIIPSKIEVLENNRSRFPGFGKLLFEWLLPIFPELDKNQKKLYLAACYLHDTIWQAHPDYRSEVCFETVTGANLGGIDHSGRIFLAISLMSRYKKTDLNEINEKYLTLLNITKIKEAIILGACMRLGAMLSVNIKENLIKTKIYIQENTIYLKMMEKDNLFGDAVEKRLNHLSTLMNLKSKIFLE